MKARAITIAALAAASVGIAAGCSAGTTTVVRPAATTAPPSAAAAPAAPAQPANPVPVVKQAGASTSAVYGETDVYGDREVQGDITGATIPGCNFSYSVTDGSTDPACLESVQVYTYAAAAGQATYEDRPGNESSDDAVLISGHLFDVIVYGVSADYGNTWKFPVSPATVAARVHGTVIPS
jgi:hypothetical protein